MITLLCILTTKQERTEQHTKTKTKIKTKQNTKKCLDLGGFQVYSGILYSTHVLDCVSAVSV